MTQYPPGGPYPGQPIDYGTQPLPTKPASITVVAILAIIVGSLGTLCCGVLGVFGSVANMAVNGGTPLPDGTVIKADAGVLAFNLALGVADLVTCVTLLVCGVGALSLKPWARSLGIVASAIMLVVAVVHITGTLAYTGPKTEVMFKQMEQSMANTPGQQAPPNIAKLVSGATIGVGIGIFILRIIVPALILMLWTKRSVKDWFAPPAMSAQYSSGGYPPRPYPPQ